MILNCLPMKNSKPKRIRLFRKKNGILAELKKLDDKQNNWIDLADRIYAFLSVQRNLKTITLEDRRYILSSTGSKIILKDGKLDIEGKKVFRVIESTAKKEPLKNKGSNRRKSAWTKQKPVVMAKILTGSPDWIRTSDLTVNSRLLYRWATEEHTVPVVFSIFFFPFDAKEHSKQRKTPKDFPKYLFPHASIFLSKIWDIKKCYLFSRINIFLPRFDFPSVQHCLKRISAFPKFFRHRKRFSGNSNFPACVFQKRHTIIFWMLPLLALSRKKSRHERINFFPALVKDLSPKEAVKK